MYSSAKKVQRVLSAGEIRKTFIDYFTHNHDHKFVRSSPVVPFYDPSLSFVNAGMNQFKSVFLGTTMPPAPRVTNSQKCVRVGGKHNDLSVVGTDGYHHTFFEMLGNWSFNDYFKNEACTMALELLRGPYGIDQQRLYVTYFGGDQALGLPADTECYEIWRKLGFPPERILPFSGEHNFWEMGAFGPCGPCSEIHLDHHVPARNPQAAAKLVNAGQPDLTELWNLVFIQYKRNVDGSITELPAKHVDTGMGFERLTAVLQHKTSNYDTDLFTPILQAIHKACHGIPIYAGQFPTTKDAAILDSGYRIIADHMRMVAVCLADGMLPDQNQKLRRVLRKVFTVSEQVFKNEQLACTLLPVIVETLGSVYPELCVKQAAVHDLVKHEQEVFRSLRASSAQAFCEAIGEYPQLEQIDLTECPGFVPAYREFQAQKRHFQVNNDTISGEFLYKLYDTYGLTEEHFHMLGELEHMKCDMLGFQAQLAAVKRKMQNANTGLDRTDALLAQLTQHLPDTEQRFRYCYSYNSKHKEYELPLLCTNIQGLLYNNKAVTTMEELRVPVTSTPTNEDRGLLYLLTKSSNFYYESGGQQADHGKIIVTPTGILCQNWRIVLDVLDVKLVNNCVVHVCQLPGYLQYIDNDNEVPSQQHIDVNREEHDDDKAEEPMVRQLQSERVKARIRKEVQEVKLKIGDIVHLQVEPMRRKFNTCHHTGMLISR